MIFPPAPALARREVALRALWKGWLRLDEITCPVGLHSVVSTSERIVLHTVNRATGHRLRRDFVDAGTGKPVERADQVKGYEIAPGEYLILEPEEIAAVMPGTDKTISVGGFIACDAIDRLYFDKPYRLLPADAAGQEAFVLVREGMRARKVAAFADAVLFRRNRRLIIYPEGEAMIAQILHFDYEMRAEADAFADVPRIKVQGEMLDLAKHIIQTKAGRFDPAKFDDRYEAAVAELVRAKLAGRKIAQPKARKEEKVVDLMAALRASAGVSGKKPASRPARKAG